MTRLNRRTFMGLASTLMGSGRALSSDRETLQGLIENTPKGERMILPPGRLTIDSPLRINRSISIKSSPDTVLVNAHPRSPFFVVLASNVELEDLFVIGFGESSNARGSITHGDSILIGDRSTKISNVAIRNLTSENIGDSAVSIEGGNRNRQNFVSNVSIDNAKLIGAGTFSNYHAGIYIHGGEEIAISNSDIQKFGQCILTTALTRSLSIYKNVLHNTSKQHGIYLSGATENVSVQNNLIHDVAGSGIKCSAPRTQIINNTISRPRVWGINLKADLDDIEISGNTILDTGDDGIDSGFEKSHRTQQNIRITGNDIIGSNDNGINFAHDKDNCTYRNITISKNNIISSASNGIRIRWNRIVGSQTNGITISDNSIAESAGTPIALGRKTGHAEQKGMRDVLISGNNITSSRAVAVPAIRLNNVSAAEVTGNTLNGYSCNELNRAVGQAVNVIVTDNREHNGQACKP